MGNTGTLIDTGTFALGLHERLNVTGRTLGKTHMKNLLPWTMIRFAMISQTDSRVNPGQRAKDDSATVVGVGNIKDADLFCQ